MLNFLLEAMLELYDNVEVLTFPQNDEQIIGQDVRKNEYLTDKTTLMAKLADKLADILVFA